MQIGLPKDIISHTHRVPRIIGLSLIKCYLRVEKYKAIGAQIEQKEICVLADITPGITSFYHKTEPN